MRLFYTRFEKAYIRLYNSEIDLKQFYKECGIKGEDQAWKALCEYRKRVISGEIRDPRDRFNRWYR